MNNLEYETLKYVLNTINNGTFSFVYEEEGKTKIEKKLRDHYAYLSRFYYIDWDTERATSVLTPKGQKLLSTVEKVHRKKMSKYL
jgi:hypothetical protein